MTIPLQMRTPSVATEEGDQEPSGEGLMTPTYLGRFSERMRPEAGPFSSLPYHNLTALAWGQHESPTQSPATPSFLHCAVHTEPGWCCASHVQHCCWRLSTPVGPEAKPSSHRGSKALLAQVTSDHVPHTLSHSLDHSGLLTRSRCSKLLLAQGLAVPKHFSSVRSLTPILTGYKCPPLHYI
jgi:hypothetical protein